MADSYGVRARVCREYPELAVAKDFSIPGCARIRRTVFSVEAFHTIGPRSQLEIDVRIRYLVACRPIADHEEDGIILCEVQEMMAVASAGWKADAGALPYGLSTPVRHKHQFPLKHINELVLLGMSVSSGRLTTRQHTNEIDAVILEAGVIAQAAIIALTLSLPERLGIAGCVALRHVGRSKYLRSSYHGCLLADREDCQHRIAPTIFRVCQNGASRCAQHVLNPVR
jgi:hypothetical protein